MSHFRHSAPPRPPRLPSVILLAAIVALITGCSGQASTRVAEAPTPLASAAADTVPTPANTAGTSSGPVVSPAATPTLPETADATVTPASHENTSPSPATSADATPTTTVSCGQGTLNDTIDCIVGYMPRELSGGYRRLDPAFTRVLTNTNLVQAWRGTIRHMLDSNCDRGVLATPSSELPNIYTMRSLQDAGQTYCILVETAAITVDGKTQVERGWGTFITNTAPARELSIDIVHPLADTATITQGLDVFKSTGARSFLMAGAHRYANCEQDPDEVPTSTPISEICTVDRHQEEAVSDVAHNVSNLFQVTTDEIRAFYRLPVTTATPWAALQFHGMGKDTYLTSEVHITYGVTVPTPDARMYTLATALAATYPVTVTLQGSGACNRNGTTNVQGRVLNGMPQDRICCEFATDYTGHFIHIEQDPNHRNAAPWVTAIATTWPVPSPTP